MAKNKQMFKYLKKKLEKRSVPDPSWQALQNLTGFGTLQPYVGREALQITAVNSCVTIICNSLASLPPAIYRGGSRVKIENHSLMPLLRNPTRDLSWYDLVSLLTADYLLYGNAVAVWDNSLGREHLTPIPWHSVSLQGTEDDVMYDVAPPVYAGSPTTTTKRYTSDRVLHWRDMIGSRDGGYTGQGALSRCRDAVNLSATLDNNVGNFFTRAISACGIFSTKGKMSLQQRQAFRDELTARFSGSQNSGQFFLFDTETDYKNIETTNEQAQVAELRKQQTKEMARVFSLPQWFVDSEATTFASSVESRKALVAQVLQPLAKSFQSVFNIKFLPEEEQLILDTSALTREAISFLDLKKEDVITGKDIRKHYGIESELDA